MCRLEESERQNREIEIDRKANLLRGRSIDRLREREREFERQGERTGERE